MREQFDDYEKRIMEKIDQEAEEIQQAIKENPEIANLKANAELDRKVFAEIEAYEEAVSHRELDRGGKATSMAAYAEAGAEETENNAYVGLSEKDLEALRLGREIQERHEAKKRRKAVWKSIGIGKRVAAAGIVLVLVMGIGVNSLGGPEMVVEKVRNTFGGRDTTRINSSTEITKATEDSEEEQAYQQIKDELGIEPVKIIKPSGDMKYKYFDIDSDIRMAHLIYEYGDRNISYIIDASYTKETWGTDIEDEKTDEYIYTVESTSITVTEYELPESKKKEYTAEFEYEGIYYQLTAVVNQNIFERILDNLHFS